MGEKVEEGAVDEARFGGPERAPGQQRGLPVEGFGAGAGQLGLVDGDGGANQRVELVEDQLGPRCLLAQSAQDVAPQAALLLTGELGAGALVPGLAAVDEEGRRGRRLEGAQCDVAVEDGQGVASQGEVGHGGQFRLPVDGVEVGGEGRRVEVGDADLGPDLGQPVDQFTVVRVAAVDDAEPGGRGDRRDLPELLHARRHEHGAVGARELVEGGVPVGRIERQPGQQHPQDLVVVHRERLHGQVVGLEEAGEQVRVAGGGAGDPRAQPLGEGVADGGERVVLVQGLAGRRRAQALGVDDTADEERPLGQDLLGLLGQQHALDVHAMAVTAPGRHRLGQHTRCP